MAGSTFGKIFRLHSFGESHGKAIGGIIDGCPANVKIDFEKVQHQLNRRKPGQSDISSPRKESDTVVINSGFIDNVSLGTPIGLEFINEDTRSQDYSNLETVYRPSHADYVYDAKYGIREHKGGGRASARETAVRVAAGAIAQQILESQNVSIVAYVSSIGGLGMKAIDFEVTTEKVDLNLVRCPNAEVASNMLALIEEVKKEGDTLGGIITCIIKGCPAGWGEPVFDKLHADLAKAMLSINAVKGFEFGSGFEAAKMKGSAHNDEFVEQNGKVSTKTNFSGGIQGGISNGEIIYFNVAFKPVASIKMEQHTIDKEGNNVSINIQGRHDPCVVPRAVPIVEAMAALVLVDHFLRNKSVKF
jgi:chorismate synthase